MFHKSHLKNTASRDGYQCFHIILHVILGGAVFSPASFINSIQNYEMPFKLILQIELVCTMN